MKYCSFVILFHRNQFASPRKEGGIPSWQKRTTTEEQPVEETGNTTVQNATGHDPVESSD